jgi:acetyl-CoA acyltransferase 2
MSVYGHNVRFGTKLGQDLAQVDTLWAALTDSHTNTPMGVTAENLAVKFGITRQQVDEFALSSQQAWARAQQGGVFKDEIAPITLKGRKGPEEFSVDEHPRIDTTLESLAKLPPVFKKDGVVTAGSSSGICDGAASLVLASEDAVREHSLKPLARIVGWATAGVEPTEMGIGPVPAIEAVLKKAGLRLQDVGLIEVNEAFGAQFLAVEKALGLDRGITNTAGGAIAMGHPLGASGARITGHLALRLAASKGAIKYALGSACIGGGQGMAVLLSSV